MSIVHLRGKTRKAVACEACGILYFFMIEREATGQAHTAIFWTELDESLAHERAEQALEKRLASEVDVAPCPKCGHVQTEMVREAKARRGKWLQFAGVIVCGLGCVLTIMDLFLRLPIWPVITSLVAIGGTMLLVRLVLRRLHDPNKAPLEKRLALARKVSVAEADYGRWSRPESK